MQTRHSDTSKYFEEQAHTMVKFGIPFLEEACDITEKTIVAEIGCGNGGNMLPFLEAGCEVYGIDINAGAIDTVREIYQQRDGAQPRLIASDIYDVDPAALPKFDVIVMRDVLEHIHDQERFIGHLSGFLKPDGVVFIAFPPFAMPFGGHQQMCVNRWASRLPYYHLLPRALYKRVLRTFGETAGKTQGLLEIKDTRLHLWKFHRIVKRSQFRIVKEKLYLINPNYEVKFGLKPRKLPWVLNIPIVRELFTTTCYVILERK